MKTKPIRNRVFPPALAIVLRPLLCSCTMAQSEALGRAYGSYGKGNYATGMKRLSEAETYGGMTAQRHAEVLLLKGPCLEGMGNPGEGVSLYEYLIKTCPDTEFTARAQGRIDEIKKPGRTIRRQRQRLPRPFLEHSNQTRRDLILHLTRVGG